MVRRTIVRCPASNTRPTSAWSAPTTSGTWLVTMSTTESPSLAKDRERATRANSALRRPTAS